MGKNLFKKRWAILLLLMGLLFSSCDKDYNISKLDDSMVLKDWSLGFPIGIIRYSALDIAKKANFGNDIVVENDTLFLLYYATLEFSASPGTENIGYQTINVFQDVEEGSVLYFSNPVFNCKVENKSDNPLTFNINSIVGKKENHPDISFHFNGSTSYSMPIPENKTIIQRFDRMNGETNMVFKIGNSDTGVGPDIIEYNVSHTGVSNNDISADVTAKLPLSFDQGSRIIFRDTLSLDLASYKKDYEEYENNIEFVEITLNYINKLPVGGATEFIFLDENNASVHGLDIRKSNLNKADLRPAQMQGFTSNISQKEKAGTIYITFTKSEWDAAKNIKYMVVKSTLTNPENIHILPDDFLQFKVGFYLKGSIKIN